MNNITTHTPGPWHVDHDQASHGEKLCIVDAEGDIIVRTPITLPESPERAQDQANADLLAAAPELLVACREVAEWLDLLKQNYPDMAGLIRGCQKARAAIAKAEGRV